MILDASLISFFQPTKEKSVEHRTAAPDAYAAVGGLDRQISQIRDLIEIPLTRPELFRHFGS